MAEDADEPRDDEASSSDDGVPDSPDERRGHRADDGDVPHEVPGDLPFDAGDGEETTADMRRETGAGPAGDAPDDAPAGDAPDDAPADDATDAEHPARTETEAAATAGEGAEPPPDVDAPRGEPAAVPAEAEAAGGDGLAAGPGATFSGPQSDQEMPLADHIEEMVRRLAVVVLVAAGVSALVLPLGDTIVTWLWDSILVDTTARPHLYSPPELIITQIKVASLAGLVVALPVVVYESYLFMRPGLYPHERRYFLAAVPTSLVLAFVGLTFGYFVVLPAVFTYFLRYSEETATIAFALSSTLDLILVLMGYLAVVFQIPLFVMLALVMGLVTRRWLVRRRLLFWGSFAGISFFFSPDPTGVSPLIIAATMISLFEGTLFLARWTKAGQRT